MITGIIAVLFLIGMIGAYGDGEIGAVVLGAVIVVVVLAVGSISRQCDRAVNNVVDYWADGGPDGRRRG